MKYKTETIFISKGEDAEKFRDFENYVKEHYIANKSQNFNYLFKIFILLLKYIRKYFQYISL